MKFRATFAAFVLFTAGAPTAHAAPDAFLGEIFMMGSNFCPRGSLPANGQILPIAENPALFSLLGTTYGGDGRVSFALPDLRGRTPVHAGTGPGLNDIKLGQRGGAEAQTLSQANMPRHTHPVQTSQLPATSDDPSRATFGVTEGETTFSDGAEAGMSQMGRNTIGETGSNQAFSIRDPFTAVTFCIATEGVFPSRS
ncbi:MAG: tail fiber protein [Pseudomonadota bacterium]